MGWREADRLHLRGILTALKSEETSVREVLEGLNDVAPDMTVPAKKKQEAKPENARNIADWYLRLAACKTADSITALLNEAKSEITNTDDWDQFSMNASEKREALSQQGD